MRVRGVAVAVGLIVLTTTVGWPARAERKPYLPDAAELRKAYERADGLRADVNGRVFKASIHPHWLDGNTRFWYRNDGRNGTKEFILVDAEHGTRTTAFDHARLADALNKSASTHFAADKLPFAEIEFLDGGKALKVAADGSYWRCDLDSYECTKLGKGPATDSTPALDSDQPPLRRPGRRTGPPPAREPESERSPDGKWVAEIRDFNVIIRPAGRSEGQTFGRRPADPDDAITLSTNGQPDNPFASLVWSPDSKTLVAYRVERGSHREVTLVESAPREGGRAKVYSRPYDLPGDRFDAYEMWLFDVSAKKATKVDADRIDFHGAPRIRWKKGNSHFTYEKTDRGHQRFRVIEVDVAKGKTRNLIDEQAETFVDTYSSPYIHYLEKSEEILFKSERDGWAHLYLIDGKDGSIKARVTQGEWVVRGVDRVDEDARQVWFRASGKSSGQDPYLIHFYRANLDGSGLVALTDGDGNHTVQYSPGRKFLIDTYSRVDMAPVHELRRTSDGALICPLERADTSALEEVGWTAPEVFHAKGRDGKTDIWGLAIRPRGFDANKAYPVIESIYAGPHGSHVPKTFAAFRPTHALAELGFVVVQIDGMGTANRSRAFHDVCWHNVADAGFPDRILWIKALAEKYPYIDTGRVGIYGTSAGGQSSTGALLFHPDFYKVAVSSCGCHDNRMDKASWNEQWMGYPVGPHYAENSNITHAGKLQGKLLLIVGELDTNVPPESTYRLADALIKANKDFEFLMIPGADHSDGGRYGERRRRDFFVRHLLGVAPPDRNAEATKGTVAASEPRKADRAVTRASLALPAQKPAPDEGNPLGDLDPAHAGMREVIERYTTDANSLRRALPADASPTRLDRMRRFQHGWLSALESLDFGAMDQTGKVDYLLLKSHAEHELRQLDVQAQTQAETAPLLPFAQAIRDLEEARRRLDPIDAPKTAEALTALEKAVKSARKLAEESLKGDQPKVSKTVAGRAARAATALRSTFQSWNGFYSGYDPLFTWWTAEPYKALDKTLGDYAGYLRERSGASKSDDDDAIVGDPIGREALLSELTAAMISYPPEQLVAIANTEFAWCEAEMKKASREMGYGDDWKKALEHVKSRYVEPGKQPALIHDLAIEAIKFIDDHNLVTVPALARDTWRMEMMSPERQRYNPFFTGGEVITVSFPTSGMTHEQKMMSMRGNNIHFSRATVHHELIPGHHLQGFMAARHKAYRRLFNTPFLVEGWSLYWEALLWDMKFPKSPEDKIGMLFWRMHRCARIIFSLGFHLGTMTPKECVDFLVDRVGHERDNASAEVRRSFAGGYGPLYQAAYMLGGLQIKALRKELVESGKMSDRAFHDAILRENAIPIAMIRASLSNQSLSREFTPGWLFYGTIDAEKK